MRHLLLLLLMVGFLQAEEKPHSFIPNVGNSECEGVLKELSEFRLLFVLPEYVGFLENAKKTEPLKKKLSTWSTDLLLRIALPIQGAYLSRCTSPQMEALYHLLQAVYLEKLGFTARETTSKDTELLFRGLIALKDEVPALKEKLLKLKKRKSALQILEFIYGYATELNGIAVIANKKVSLAGFTTVIHELCAAREGECLFNDKNTLYKIVVTEEKSVAAFIPEVGTLILSEELVHEPNVLMKIVMAHELVHVATHAVWNRERQDWGKEFSALSGIGEVVREKTSREDLLTEISKGSNYSILPDGVLKLKKGEGFVFEKSYTQSVKAQDTSEDMADTVAVRLFFPERFCWKDAPFAPKKRAWVENRVLTKVKAFTDCKKVDSK